MSESSSLVMKNAPPATTTTTAPVEPLPHKSKDGVEKDAKEEDRTDPEADPTIPNLPEQEEATKKPCEHSFRFPTSHQRTERNLEKNGNPRTRTLV
jgi:hypothetical protein